jgi:hypothetical protein
LRRAQRLIFFLSGLFLAPTASMAACIFSHTRGTAKKIVGCTSFKFAPSLSRLSANQLQAPTCIGPCRVTICSAMWLSGR